MCSCGRGWGEGGFRRERGRNSMSSYRFCRTDDIALLVDALNRCWAPYAPGEPPMTPEAFKRSIRDLQVWCSSCMVAFSGVRSDRRPDRREAPVRDAHPHDRRPSRPSAAGPRPSSAHVARLEARDPRPAAPRRRGARRRSIPACELFRTSGYVEEAPLTDCIWDGRRRRGRATASSDGVGGGRFVIPVTVDDLAANDLLEQP